MALLPDRVYRSARVPRTRCSVDGGRLLRGHRARAAVRAARSAGRCPRSRPSRRRSTHPGRLPNTSQPASVAQTRCTYVYGVSADAGPRWNARMNRKWPIVPTQTAGDDQREIGPRRVDAHAVPGQHGGHHQRADDRRVEQQHARVLARELARQDLERARRRRPHRATAVRRPGTSPTPAARSASSRRCRRRPARSAAASSARAERRPPG